MGRHELTNQITNKKTKTMTMTKTKQEQPPRGGKTPESPALSLTCSQVQKAQIEKAEIKADMTKERLELSQVSNLLTHPPFNI